MAKVAALLRRHAAASPQRLAISATKPGNHVLCLHFEAAAAFTKVADPISATAEFRAAWQAHNQQAGQINWVSSNHDRKGALDG